MSFLLILVKSFRIFFIIINTLLSSFDESFSIYLWVTFFHFFAIFLHTGLFLQIILVFDSTS